MMECHDNQEMAGKLPSQKHGWVRGGINVDPVKLPGSDLASNIGSKIGSLLKNSIVGGDSVKKGLLASRNAKLQDLKTAASTSDIIHVCLSTDEATLIGLVATINSIHSNTQHPVKYHIITEEHLVSDIRSWISGSTLSGITYDIKILDEHRITEHTAFRGMRADLGKPMNYAPIYYAELLPDVHRVVHLDDDAIVQGDIHELWSTKLQDGDIGGFSSDCKSLSKHFNLVPSVYSSYINFNNADIKSLHMDPATCSFNSGIFVVDLDLWRKLNVTQQAEKWMKLNIESSVYGSEKGGGSIQPLLMIVLYHRYTSLDPLWNVRHLGYRIGGKYSPSLLQNAKLLHWSGRFKPWDGISQHQELWNKYYLKDPGDKYLPVRKNNDNDNEKQNVKTNDEKVSNAKEKFEVNKQMLKGTMDRLKNVIDAAKLKPKLT